ncbi:MAG: hypothetical protein SGARI_005780 [Bacillariaceae sp.]
MAAKASSNTTPSGAERRDGDNDIEAQTRPNDLKTVDKNKKKWTTCVLVFAILLNLGIIGFSIATLVAIATDYQENMASTTSSYRQKQYTADYSMALGMTVPLLVMGCIGLLASTIRMKFLLWTSIGLYALGMVLFFGMGGASKNMATFGVGLLLILPLGFEIKLLNMIKDGESEDEEGNKPNKLVTTIQSPSTSSDTTTSSELLANKGVKNAAPSPTVSAAEPKTSKRNSNSSAARNKSIAKKQPPSPKKDKAPSSPKKRSSSPTKKGQRKSGASGTKKKSPTKQKPKPEHPSSSPKKKKPKKASIKM